MLFYYIDEDEGNKKEDGIVDEMLENEEEIANGDKYLQEKR